MVFFVVGGVWWWGFFTYVFPQLQPKPTHTRTQLKKNVRDVERLERLQRDEAARRAKMQHQTFLGAVLAHARDFREFHRACAAKSLKTARAVVQHIAASERGAAREAERQEKERMKRLMVRGFFCVVICVVFVCFFVFFYLVLLLFIYIYIYIYIYLYC